MIQCTTLIIISLYMMEKIIQICDRKSPFVVVIAPFSKCFFYFISYKLLISNKRDNFEEIQIIIFYLED